jgi:hypothetical protein
MTDEHLALEHAIVDAINAAIGANNRMSVSELARQMGRPYDSTRNYLALDRRLPLEFLIAVAGALGTTPDELIKEARTKYLQKRLQGDA